MNKRDRHELIKNMIRQDKIGRQADIQAGLEKNNVFVTQTTLSRDLRELGLIKVHENGQSYYALAPDQGEKTFAQLLSEYTYKVERASFMLVCHSELGEAAMMANIIDTEKPSNIIGTLAGADTLLVICRDEASAIQVEEEINEFLKDKTEE